ncbi:MAG: hypothetical protein EXX96DRAFT_568612 [Benjaminiella poitrasii]|nr:MAG: hypothetical protein EXX96DRAFT_568612 [Benjaminiella poitrasii]
MSPQHYNVLYYGDTNPATIHVSELQPNVTESILLDIFKATGSIYNIRIIQDPDSGTNTTAYITYQDSQDAKRAQMDLNRYPIFGRPCHITQSLPKPTTTPTTILLISNLSTLNLEQIQKHFSTYGPIHSCYWLHNHQHKALIQFADPTSADRALQTTHQIDSTTHLHVRPYEPESTFRKIIMTNIDVQPNSTTQLKLLCETVGEVVWIRLERFGHHYRHAVIKYRHPNQARRALIELWGRLLNGQRVLVVKAPPDHVVFVSVSRVPSDWREEDLRTVFHGVKVVSVHWAPCSRSALFAFETGEAAAMAVMAVQHVLVVRMARPEHPWAVWLQQVQASPIYDALCRACRALVSYSVDIQKQILAERLYPLVLERVPEFDQHVTWILLEQMSILETLVLIHDLNWLTDKIQEIMYSVLTMQQQRIQPIPI